VWCDVVSLLHSLDQPRCRILHSLKTINKFFRQARKQSVAFIESRQYKDMHKCSGRSSVEKPTDTPDRSKMKTGRSANTSHIPLHRELRVKGDSEIRDGVRQQLPLGSLRSRLGFLFALVEYKSSKSALVIVEFQPIPCHPVPCFIQASTIRSRLTISRKFN
jgi:hypothetical protein